MTHPKINVPGLRVRKVFLAHTPIPLPNPGRGGRGPKKNQIIKFGVNLVWSIASQFYLSIKFVENLIQLLFGHIEDSIVWGQRLACHPGR